MLESVTEVNVNLLLHGGLSPLVLYIPAYKAHRPGPEILYSAVFDHVRTHACTGKCWLRSRRCSSQQARAQAQAQARAQAQAQAQAVCLHSLITTGCPACRAN